MAGFINEQKWRQAVTSPDWYLRIQDDYQALMEQADQADEPTKTKIKEEVYSLIEELLDDGHVYLGSEGYDFDKDRKAASQVIVHHTSQRPGLSLSRLNAIHLMRLYVPYYTNPSSAVESQIKGKPIHSGHYHGGKQVFWAYHWLVRNDGSTQRLLDDDEIGWQAGDWEVNCRSAAVCFDDDLTSKRPTKAALQAAGEIIRKHYSGKEVLGHREVNPDTICPGGLYLNDWQQDLLELVMKESQK